MAGELEKAQAAQAAVESSIAKIREAQKKFEETKAKVEAAKKKAEDAVKKAKALQQTIKILRAQQRTPGAVKGGIAVVAASQVGALKGALAAQILKRVITMLSKFSSGCPDNKELQKIIKVRSTLLKHLTSFEKRVNAFAAIANQLTAIVSVIKIIIQLITSIPLPTAIIPPQTGGIGIPVSVLTKYSNALVKVNKKLDTIITEAAAITGIINTVSPIITNLKNRLESIDIAIEQCSIGNPADLSDILATAQPPQNTGSEGTPTDAQGNPDPNYQYKGYVLAIIQDPNSPKIAPRRYAVAKDRIGTIRLRGESSFSSDTQVLLDELKFKIDNQFT
jgi:hypothetical protein